MMSRNRYLCTDSFVVCFYCNATFRSLASLIKHCCSAEEKISLDCESLDNFSDINSIDLEREDSVDSMEISSEKHKEVLDQESNSSIGDIPMAEANPKSELAAFEAKSDASRLEATILASGALENYFHETSSDVVTEITDLATNLPVEQLSETISDILREIINQVTNALERQSSESNSYLKSEVTNLVINSSEKQLSKATSNAKEVPEQSIDISKQLSVEISDTGQKIIESEDRDVTYPDLVSKVLQYYEKQTRPVSPDSFCKSPFTEVEFQSPHIPLISEECGSSMHNEKHLECNDIDNCNKSLSSDTICDTHEDNLLKKESDALKPKVRELGHLNSDMSCGVFPRIESYSTKIPSRSSSVEMDSNSWGCDDASIESDNSEPSNSTLLAKKSNSEKHDLEQETQVSECDRSEAPFLEEDLKSMEYNSSVIKPCWVQVEDIFKKVKDPKVSPKKIFSRKKKYHVCDVCNKFFRLKTDLNIHYLIHTTVKPYICNICNKSFVKQCNLFAHHLAHTVKKRHVCPHCKKVFLNKSDLLRHKLTHTKLKPYACDKCEKAYTIKSSLTEHMLSHSSERPFICEICSASFCNKRYLRRHYHLHQKKPQAYSCDLCFKTFTHKHHLREHYNMHTNYKPYECKICNRSFYLLLHLNCHINKSHKNKMRHAFPGTVKTIVDSKTAKNPVIQKLEISVKNDKKAKSPVIQKIEISAKGDKKKAPVEKPVILINTDNFCYSTRRKAFIPRKHV